MPVVSLRHHPKFENCNVDKKKSRIFPVKELSNVVGCHAEEEKILCSEKSMKIPKRQSEAANGQKEKEHKDK